MRAIVEQFKVITTECIQSLYNDVIHTQTVMQEVEKTYRTSNFQYLRMLFEDKMTPDIIS